LFKHNRGFAGHGRQRQDRIVIDPNIYVLKFCSIYKMLWHPDSFVFLDSIIGAVGLCAGALPAYRQVGFLLAT
jgi:hypothetical protein